LDRLSEGFKDGALRLVNGLAAGWLGYILAAQILPDGAQAAGIAAGLGVLAYLLPRLGALGVIVALAVLLIRNGTGLGFTALAPVLGGVWVMGVGSANGDVKKMPLGPALAVPLTLIAGLGVTLGVGLPLLFGALMRPLGACLSAAVSVFTVLCYELTISDGVFANGFPFAELPFTGAHLDIVPKSLGIERLLQQGQAILEVYPQLLLLILLWAAMAGVVSLAEWAGKPFIGLVVAVAGGALGYALLVSPNASPGTLTSDMISLVLAAIIYGVLRYLVSRARG
jgi:eukaryotic-like serine/threonine-protein kinase